MKARLLPLLVFASLISSSITAQSGTGVPDLGRRPVLEALAKAYPDSIVLNTGDEAVTVNGKEFVWAEGRLLPPELAARWADYAPQPFYPYPRDVPDIASWSDDKVADAEARLAQRRNNAPRRSSGFFDALWGISSESEADDHQQSVRFLGFKVTVHRALIGPLSRVEARLNAGRTVDPTLDAFLNGLAQLDGYNWRDIAETRSRSNHSYGAAIDIIPKAFGGRIPYWLWARQDKPGWYRAAWANRWQPHPAVIAAFEAEGFLWGGKWLLFDTIHFEYRPEILILNGMR